MFYAVSSILNIDEISFYIIYSCKVTRRTCDPKKDARERFRTGVPVIGGNFLLKNREFVRQDVTVKNVSAR